MPRIKTKNKRRPQPVRFNTGSAEVIAVAMGKIGASTKAIKSECNLSDHQIAYRLNKAKELEQRDQGYRTAYRNGESPEFRKIMRDHMAVIKADIEYRMPRLIVSPARNGHKLSLRNGNG
jgi:hypothetical protein